MSIEEGPHNAARVALATAVMACQQCAAQLPQAPAPVLQMGFDAPILIAGQAPGRRAHANSRPFTDASGVRLRQWLGVDEATFYNPRWFSILPMGFCFPGSNTGGDLPPRPECADHWRQRLLAEHRNVQLTLVIGRYAQAWHLPSAPKHVTACVELWQEYWPQSLPLPHPSPRNQRWFRVNPWFEHDVLPALRTRVQTLLREMP